MTFFIFFDIIIIENKRGDKSMRLRDRLRAVRPSTEELMIYCTIKRIMSVKGVDKPYIFENASLGLLWLLKRNHKAIVPKNSRIAYINASPIDIPAKAERIDCSSDCSLQHLLIRLLRGKE